MYIVDTATGAVLPVPDRTNHNSLGNDLDEVPLTPWDVLMAVEIDIDTISNEEAQSIMDAIERQHGRIIVPDVS